MNPLTAALLLKVMDIQTVRSSAAAENIANANTPGYRPVKVRFEDALRAAAKEGKEAVTAMRPTLEQADAVTSASGVRLDLEMADAGAAAGRYGMTAELLSRQLQLDALAVSGGA